MQPRKSPSRGLTPDLLLPPLKSRCWSDRSWRVQTPPPTEFVDHPRFPQEVSRSLSQYLFSGLLLTQKFLPTSPPCRQERLRPPSATPIASLEFSSFKKTSPCFKNTQNGQYADNLLHH